MLFETHIDIDAPPERVWTIVQDVERWHEWTASITSVRLAGKAFAVGSRAVIKQPKFPPATWTVTALTPGRSFEWTSVAPGLRVIGRHVVAPHGPNRSRVTLSVECAGAFGGLWGRLTKGITERYIAMEAAGLKKRSELPAAGLRAPASQT